MISERISDDMYTSTYENFEYGYTHSNAFLQFCLKLWQVFDLIQSDAALQKQVH